jgi:ATP-dependent exoDNAse (exonuclease V) beta subunit
MTTLIDDAPARARIETDLDTNLCVEAGAGTGKTTVLVARVVALLRSGGASVDDLAVITFTEKAAGELSARVRFELERALDDARLGEDEHARIEQALLDLYRARIQTIHAFAADLLRERPVEARLDPQFETLDDLKADVRFEEAYRRWLDGQLAERNEPVERAMRRGFELRALRRLVETVHRNREALPLAEPEPTTPDVGGFEAALAGWTRQLKELQPRCHAPEDAAHCHLEEVVEFHAKVERATDRDEVERLILFEAAWPRLKVGQAGNWDEAACSRVRDILTEYRSRLGQVRSDLRTDALVGLLPLAEDFAESYARERRGDGVADFDDLLLWARDLLRGNHHVRQHFHRRTRRVFVDEFQDTDPVQAELIAWLCAPPGAEGDWRALEPEPGSLFVVGDPKQSIYRFRGADMGIYDTVKRGPLAGELEYLTRNFRSSDELLHWLNRLFDRVLGDGRRGVQPPNAPLDSGISMAAELGRPPVVVVRSGAGAETAAGRRDEEFGLIARTVSRAVRDEAWPVRDPLRGDAVRPAQWRDVAILVPARTGIERLESALQRYGVPYRFEGGRGFFARQEVRDVISLLHAVDDPTDAISIVAALRSLAFGCSDEDLLLWQIEHERFDYRAVRTDAAGPEAVRDAMLMMADLNRAARGLSLAELVRTAIERTGLVEAALSLPSGAQSAANVMKLLDHAREFSAAGSGALRAFTGWLARQRESQADEPDAPVAEERDDAVRVMTIHAAKGLEFPIVCLANLESTGPGGQTDAVGNVQRGRIELKLGSKSQGSAFCTPGWDEVKPKEDEALEAERDRLLYVAATRARDHLVIPVCGDKSDRRSFMSRLRESLPKADGDVEGGQEIDDCWLYDVSLLERIEPAPRPTETPAETAAVEAAGAARDRWDHDHADLMRERRHGIEIVTASGLKVDPRPLAAIAEAPAGGGDEGPTIDKDSTPPLELGDAFHRVMEKITLPEAPDLDELAHAICAEAAIPDATDLVMDMARRCLDSDIVQRAIATGDVHREVPFVVDKDGKVLIGRLDLLFRDGDRAVVVDYKTDAVEPGAEPAAADAHRGQADVYERAVSDALGTENSVVLLFARTGTTAPTL